MVKPGLSDQLRFWIGVINHVPEINRRFLTEVAHCRSGAHVTGERSVRRVGGRRSHDNSRHRQQAALEIWNVNELASRPDTPAGHVAHRYPKLNAAELRGQIETVNHAFARTTVVHVRSYPDRAALIRLLDDCAVVAKQHGFDFNTCRPHTIATIGESQIMRIKIQK